MYYPDLSYYRVGFPQDPLQYVFPNVRYIGWLGAHSTYPSGSVSHQLCEKLREILFLDIKNAEAKHSGTFDANKAVQVHQHYTREKPHRCPFCKTTISVEPIGLKRYLGGSEKVLGRNQICLPSAKPKTATEQASKIHFYATPTLIYHYISEHQYQPPSIFLRALAAFDLDAPFDVNQAKANLACLQVPTHQVNELHLRPIQPDKYRPCPTP